MQVDPITPKLKPPGTKHLKLKCDILLSDFAFKFNLRRYSKVTFRLLNKKWGAIYGGAKAGRCMLTVSKPVLKFESAYGFSD